MIVITVVVADPMTETDAITAIAEGGTMADGTTIGLVVAGEAVEAGAEIGGAVDPDLPADAVTAGK